MTSQPSPSAPKRRKPLGACKKCDHKKHGRACRRCGCAYKSKARKPIKARNPKRRPAELATAQREAVIERSGGRCEMERSVEEWWQRCSQHGSETAHVVRRRLCGDAIYDPAVAVYACTFCHDVFDHRTHPSLWGKVRVPDSAVERAMTTIRAAEAYRELCGRAVVHLPGEKV